MPVPSSRTCPHCGVSPCFEIPGRLGWYQCNGCGTRFSMGSEDGSSHLFMERSTTSFTVNGKPVDMPQFNMGKLTQWIKRSFWVVALGAAMTMATTWLMMPSKAPTSSSSPSGKDIPIVGTAMQESSDKLSLIRIFEREDGNAMVLQSVVNDLNGGQRLSSPQDYAFPTGTKADWAQFHEYSDGKLYLILQKRKLLQYEQGKAQFLDLTPMLETVFSQKFGVSIESIEPQGNEWPDAVRVQASNGKTYYANWLAKEFVEQDKVADIFKNGVPKYTQTTQNFAFAPAEGEPGGAYLVRYWSKSEPEKIQYRSPIQLFRGQDLSIRSRSPDMQPIGNDFFLPANATNKTGLILVEPIAPMTLRFNGKVLATNPTQLLVTYEPERGNPQGRVLQIVDRYSLKVIWTQPLAQIPQLASRVGGVAELDLQAIGVRSGFYLRNGFVTPVLLLDNEGKTVFDFTQSSGSGSTTTSTGSGKLLTTVKNLFK